MDKNICLELANLSLNLPPLYSHPYHKYSIPKRVIKQKGISEKIKNLKKTENKLIQQAYSNLKIDHEYKSRTPKINISLVEKQNRQFARPITCPSGSPKVFLEMSYKIFSPKAQTACKRKAHQRGYSIS